MATQTLKLGALSTGATGALTATQLTEILEAASWGGKTLAAMQKADATSVVVNETAQTITIKGVGVLALAGDATKGVAVTFLADPAFAGDVAFEGVLSGSDTDVYFKTVDVSKATAGLTATVKDAGAKFVGGSGDDKITANKPSQTIVGGAGNDVLIVVTGVDAKATLTGGAGADTFDISGAKVGAGVSITDYTYAQGDVIKGANNVATVDGSGAITVAGADSTAVKVGTVVLDTADNVYKAKVTDGKNAVEYWTVSNAASTTVTANGSGIKNDMVMTGSNDKADILITGSGNDTINVGDAGGAVWAGAGKDKIELGTNGKGTVWFGTADGADTLSNFDAANTVINLYDSSLSNIDIVNGAANVEIKVGGSTLVTGESTVSGGTISNWQFQEKGGTVKKVSADLVGGKTIAVAVGEDSDYYMGKFDANGGSTVDYSSFAGGNGFKVDLLDTTKYKNITGIKVDKAAAAGIYIGSQDRATTIDASGATADATGMQIWGGGAHGDSIAMDTAKATDQTVWFGAGDGSDTVSGFGSGFGATSDVAYIYDTADLTTIGFAKGTGSTTNIKVGNATLNLDVDANDADGVKLQIKDSTGKINKVAVSTFDADAKIDADGANYVVATGANATAVYSAATTDDIVVNLMDAAAYKNVDNVDASLATGNVTAIGSGKGSNIKLGAGKNAVWGGGAGNDTIALNGGSAEVWYGGAFDGKDQVTTFTANDSVYFWDASLQDVVRNATFSSDSTTDVGLKFSDKNSLAIKGTALNTGINVKDNAGLKTKLLVSDQNMVFAADTKAYVSTAKAGGKVSIGGGTGDVTLYLDNINATTGNTVNDIYLKGVTELDASAGFGNYILIGAGGTTDKLTGGKGTTAMWGGGAAADVMTGGSGIDAVWFGSGDGADAFNEANVEDKVVLWSATAISDIQATYGGGGALTISTTSGDKLLINSADEATLGQLTFQVGTDDATSAKYTFDTKAKAFKAK